MLGGERTAWAVPSGRFVVPFARGQSPVSKCSEKPSVSRPEPRAVIAGPGPPLRPGRVVANRKGSRRCVWVGNVDPLSAHRTGFQGLCCGTPVNGGEAGKKGPVATTGPPMFSGQNDYIGRVSRGATFCMTSRASKALTSLPGLGPRPMTISAEASKRSISRTS